MIYFIKSPGGPIKIGTTIRLSERLKQLVAEHGEGLEVLAVVEGDRDVEQELHRRFEHLNVVNEWFEPGDDLVGFIVADGRPWDGSDEVAAGTTLKPQRGKAAVRDIGAPIGPILAENLLRLGYADIVVRAAEVARIVSEKTGRSLTRQRVSAIMNAVRVEPETIALLAEGLGVEVNELTRGASR